MRAVAVVSNRQQALWLLHLLLHAVVTLMSSARPADLPLCQADVRHPPPRITDPEGGDGDTLT